MRDGDPHADTLRQPADFYSPDTFNYNMLDVSADGKILTVTSYGINSTVQNGFVEYDRSTIRSGHCQLSDPQRAELMSKECDSQDKIVCVTPL